jgi:FixJ family two-component response regulator
MRKSIQRLLSARGFATEGFHSAEAFLDRLATSHAACLVLDIHLEGMSGIELRRRLTASGSRLPVIFITAIDEEEQEAEAIDAGCVAYLRKPFPADCLLSAINQALART